MGVNKEENPMTIMPYKVNKSLNDSYERNKFDDGINNNQNNLYSLNNDNDIDENFNSNSDNDNFDDVMKRTQAEYNKEEEMNNNNYMEDNMNTNNLEENIFSNKGFFKKYI